MIDISELGGSKSILLGKQVWIVILPLDFERVCFSSSVKRALAHYESPKQAEHKDWLSPAAHLKPYKQGCLDTPRPKWDPQNLTEAGSSEQLSPCPSRALLGLQVRFPWPAVFFRMSCWGGLQAHRTRICTGEQSRARSTQKTPKQQNNTTAPTHTQHCNSCPGSSWCLREVKSRIMRIAKEKSLAMLPRMDP